MTVTRHGIRIHPNHVLVASPTQGVSATVAPDGRVILTNHTHQKKDVTLVVQHDITPAFNTERQLIAWRQICDWLRRNGYGPQLSRDDLPDDGI
jgi:hypothetical protein